MRWDTEVCIVQAATRHALIQQIDDLLCFLQARPNVALKDLAYTLNTALDASETVRVAVVAGSTSELEQRLNTARQKLSDPKCRRIKDASGLYFFE